MLRSLISRIPIILATKNSKNIITSLRSKNKFNDSTLKRLFSEQKSNEKPKEEKEISKQDKRIITNDQKNISENKGIETKNTYRYDTTKFEQINSKSFLEKMQRIEEASKPRGSALESAAFPIFLSLTSLFIYYLWTSVPYSVIYKLPIFNI